MTASAPPRNPLSLARPDLAGLLAARVVAAVRETFGIEITLEQALVREAAREWSFDYQSNVAMPLAKRLERPSTEVAVQLGEALEVEDICEAPEVGGPGFLNLRLRSRWLLGRLAELTADPRLGVSESARPRQVVIDYSAPNVAKEMHVGHLRSTIIGDALARLLEFLDNRVIRQNHIGDWGTPFGMLIEHMVERGWGDGAGRAVEDLNAFYQAARERFDSDPDFAERARLRVVQLQGRDSGTMDLWRALVEESERHFDEVYALLAVGLGPDAIAGESRYDPQLPEIVRELSEKGLLVESDGALCVFPEGFKGRDGEPMPLIVRKRDGAYNYATTDLAALRHRVLELGANELLYVVGAPQRLHFEMVFAVAREAGWLHEGIEARHIAFGSVLGADGKMLRTRSGAPVRLVDLLQEAIDRSAAILVERGAGPEEARTLSRSIGVGAVKYADLAGDREKDYTFSFERMLSLDGNTSLYLQYANARAQSVLRRSGSEREQRPAFDLREPSERTLAVALVRLPSAVEAVLADLKPHKLCTYLHELAVAFSGFYETCPILNAEEPGLRASRLGLCELTSRTLTLGMAQLGIDAPERLSAPPPRPQPAG